MPESTRPERHYKYRLRIMASLVGTIVSMILVVKLWPPPAEPDFSNYIFGNSSETVTIDLIEPTSQSKRVPPPPAPLPPIVVPDDIEIVDEPIELDVELDYTPADGTEVVEDQQNGNDAGPGVVRFADESPRPIRFSEPELPREARRKKIRAQIIIEVLVDLNGRVEETEILERYLLDDNGRPAEFVDLLGFGLEEAAIAAAVRWRFKPAQHQGQNVKSYQTLDFKFGI